MRRQDAAPSEEDGQMGWHIIVALDSGRAQPRYFRAYKDNRLASECVWTEDRWQARWLEANEARLEAELLALLCPNYIVAAQPLSIATPQDGR
jgi:hypothetical protein